MSEPAWKEWMVVPENKIPGKDEWTMTATLTKQPQILCQSGGAPPYTSVAEATDHFDRMAKKFGSISVWIENSIHGNAGHQRTFAGAVAALERNPDAELWLIHRLLTPHTALGTWVDTLTPGDDAGISTYSSYLDRCIEAWWDKHPVTGFLLDHPDPKHYSGYGEWVHKKGDENRNSRIVSAYDRILRPLWEPTYAYGVRSWMQDGYSWYEGRKMNLSMSLYFGAAPTLSRWRQWLDTMLAQVRRGKLPAIWFDIRTQDMDEIIWFMQHPEARRVPRWIMWPGPHDSDGYTPWSKVDEFFDKLQKAGLR